MTERTPDADAAHEQALARLDALEQELESLVESVKLTIARLRADVAHTRASVHDLHARASAANVEPPIGGDAPAEPPPPPTEPTPLAEPPVGGDAPEGAEEGARLVALDLMTRGTARSEAVRELRESFPGVDAERLLDEAAATLGG